MEIAVVGGAEFTLGFRIAGIQKIVDINNQDANKIMEDMLIEQDLGIIIVDDKTMGRLDERTREKVEATVKPVTVVVSTESTAQDALRKMIIKSIGVDLWKD